MKKYLEKRAIYPPFISNAPADDLELIITIPCYNETELGQTLQSLATCTKVSCSVEVIVAINHAENADETIVQQNQKTYASALQTIKEIEREDLSFHLLELYNLPKKHAGVGLARKIAMDEAVRRFDVINNPKGIIVCLDADTLVEANYLETLHAFFTQNEKCQAAGIHYEHPLAGDHFDAEIYTAITAYELHLRYYVHALKAAGLPTATQTVGSAMAVRADAYAAQGGMNRRKAGEDFYFIHKFTPLGNYGRIIGTTILPSPRISDRVPFGTGRAVGEILSGEKFSSYSPAVFSDLSHFLTKVNLLFSANDDILKAFVSQLPLSIKTFLEQENFIQKIQEIRQHTSNAANFEKRFFRWFDAFLAMKFVHFARDNYYPNLTVDEAARNWIAAQEKYSDVNAGQMSTKELLLFFRDLDKR